MEPAAFDRLPRRTAMDLLACSLAFGVVSFIAGVQAGLPVDLWLEEWGLGTAGSAAASFLAFTLSGTSTRRFSLAIENCLYAAGLAFLAQFALAYAFDVQPVPLQLTIIGVLASAAAVGCIRALFASGKRRTPGVLIAGFDRLARELAPALGEPVVGVLDSDPERVPQELRYLGSLEDLAGAVEAARPARVIISAPHWRRRITPKMLLDLRYEGVEVEDAPAVSERVFRRVPWEQLPPIGLLFSSSANANRAAMALQSVYTNLIGLTLLLVFVPLLVAVAIATAACSGGGPVLESVECLGFGQAPFHMLRFRTPDPERGFAPACRLLAWLRVQDLPRIVNVLRGEMVLFGPPPVRRVFAERLSQLILIYPQRFTVKPGIFGWSQINVRNARMPDEALRLGYDLYYIKRNTPELDLEILARTVLARS